MKTVSAGLRMPQDGIGLIHETKKKDNRVLQQVRGGVLSIMVMLATLNSGETSKRQKSPQMGSRRMRLKKF